MKKKEMIARQLCEIAKKQNIAPFAVGSAQEVAVVSEF